MMNFFNNILGGVSNEDIQKYLSNCTIKIVENGKTLVDIENGVNKLAPEKPQDRDEDLQYDVHVHNNSYYIKEIDRPDRRPSLLMLNMLTAKNTGISNKQLLTILIDRLRDNPDKVAILKQLL